jgi:hypothetical protein
LSSRGPPRRAAAIHLKWLQGGIADPAFVLLKCPNVAAVVRRLAGKYPQRPYQPTSEYSTRPYRTDLTRQISPRCFSDTGLLLIMFAGMSFFMSISDSRIVDHPLKEMTEKEFVAASDGAPIRKEDHERTRFHLVAAKGVHFQEVSFKYCLFEDCYFRDCRLRTAISQEPVSVTATCARVPLTALASTTAGSLTPSSLR